MIDSEAALGKKRHIEVMLLWMQEAVGRRRFRIIKIRGTTNPTTFGLGWLVSASRSTGRSETKGLPSDTVLGSSGDIYVAGTTSDATLNVEQTHASK